MTIRKPPGKRLASLLLSLALLLTLVPAMGMTAAAANANAEPRSVFVDGNRRFTESELYYKNGDAQYSLTGTEDDYNAYYNPATGVLTLKGYKGGSITVGGTAKVNITIKLVGTNTVIGSVSSDMGGDITITSDSKGSLAVTSQANSNNVWGIATSLNQNFGSVTITGNANVKITATNTNNTDDGSAYGIYAYQGITVSDRASVNIICSTPNSTKRTLSCTGMFVPDSSSGKLTIATDGDIQIDAKDAGSEACSFGLSAPNYALTKVGSMEVQWKKASNTSSSDPFTRGASFGTATHAVNVDTTNCYASYRSGTPYTVTVSHGYIKAGSPGLKYNTQRGTFLKGDELTLFAPDRQASDTDTTKIPFIKWTSDDVDITDPEKQDGASFTVRDKSDKNVTVTAQYNGFAEPPKFTRISDTTGTVSFTLISGNFDEMGRPKIYPVGNSTSLGYFYTGSATQKTFTVYKNDCPDGQYVVGVSYSGVMCYSEPFRVKYTEPSAYVAEENAVTVSGKAGVAVNGTVTITLENDKFAEHLPSGEKWIQNLPDGLKETVVPDSETTVKITISGTPQVASAEDMKITIPAGALVEESGTPVEVSIGGKARFNITSNAPTADKIQIGDGSNNKFSADKLYYKNGENGAKGTFSDSSSGYNAKYDPATGTLTLNGYDGPYIWINGGNGQTVTIKTVGNNNTVHCNFDPPIQLNDGVNLIVTSEEAARLTLDAEDKYGIGSPRGGTERNIGFVQIAGRVTVDVEVFADTDNTCGISVGGDISVLEESSLKITCTSNKSGASNGIMTRGKVTVDTTGAVDINVSNCGKNVSTYCISAGSIEFKKAETITLKYIPMSSSYGPTFSQIFDASGMKTPKNTTDSATGVTTVTYAKKGAKPEKPTIEAYSLTFDRLQEVRLTCDTPGTVIYYTTDGSDPTDSSSTRTQYSKSFYVRQSCTLKAVAYSAEDEQYSAVAEAVFTRKPVSITVVGGGKAYSDPERTIEITQAEPGTTVYLKAPAETDDGTKVFSDWSSTATITNKESCDSAYFVMPTTQPTITASYKPKSAGVTVSGTVTSYGSAAEAVTVTLTKSGESTPAQTATLSAPGSGSAPFAQDYSFSAVPDGKYTLKVEKKGHAPWTEEITVSSTAITKDVTVYLWGDANGDGNINVADAMLVLRHANSIIELEPDFLNCSDVSGDGNVNAADSMMILRYANGIITTFPAE